MLNALERRNARIFEDMQYWLKERKIAYAFTIEIVSFKYELEPQTVEKIYRKACRTKDSGGQVA